MSRTGATRKKRFHSHLRCICALTHLHLPHQNGGAVFAAGCGTAETPISSDVPILHPTNFSNCTFVGNTALEAGGALKISIGRAHVENTEFIGNTASEGGALRLFGTVELFNSSFSDNRSGEGGGSAISNVGIVLETVGLSFSANRFLCAATEYVDFSEVSVVELQCSRRYARNWFSRGVRHFNMEPYAW